MARKLHPTLFFVLVAVAGSFADPQPGSVRGTVFGPLRAPVAEASVTLLQGGTSILETSTTEDGTFSFPAVAAGPYRLAVHAGSYGPETRTVFVRAGAEVAVALTLHIGLKQEVLVTASAEELPASQVGAPVTVLDRQTMDDLAKPALVESLRLVPGGHIVELGGRGGMASLFIRGGAANFNKVLVDGLPINDIGGAFDYATFQTTGVERVEVLRDANSVLYGSDALAGVVSITTRRGTTRTPLLSASLEGGSLGTNRQAASAGGAVRRLDYFGEFAHFATDNEIENNDHENSTLAGRIGWRLGGASDVTATFRRTSTNHGSPYAFDLFGIADDSRLKVDSTYVTLAAQSQLTPRWHGHVRLAWLDDHYENVNPTPTGEAFDPFGFGPSYLGRPTTIEGANGYSVTGQAILDYGGTYPSLYAADTTRLLAAGQTTYELTPALSLSAGLRFEQEDGETNVESSTERGNFGSFVEARIKQRRLYATAGLGYEHNDVFRSAWTPRLSIALYLREPSSDERIGDTKVTLNAGTGIKAPTVFQEGSSLHELVRSAPLSVASSVSPMGPERSRSLDAGVEQGLWQGRVRLRGAFFDNRYEDLIEFVGQSALVALGVPQDVAASAAYGAYFNSSSYRARGFETSADALIARNLRLMASYTYLEAEVTESFSSSALGPAENPAFPGVRIGAYAPLIGARPFRRPAHSANFLLTYLRGPAQVSLAGHLVGRSDDSTFLSDGFFGSSMLLPNRDLNGGYQKIDMSGSYRLADSRVKLYASIENVLDQAYSAAFGFPALPRTFRVGVTGTIGGDRRTGR